MTGGLVRFHSRGRLLAVGKVLELAYPATPLGEIVSLAGYCLLAGLLTVKVYRVMSKKGGKLPVLEAGILEVTAGNATPEATLGRGRDHDQGDHALVFLIENAR